ncbi:MAG: cation:proton antiporter [Candidatus Pacearchaeota archaeon]|nr:cation:proton antiporter [Candidatus Pacearchaeota archaeon]
MVDFLSIVGNAILEFQKSFSTISLSNSFIISISLVIIIAAFLALISKLLKQEFVLAYVVAGIIIGPFVLGLIQNKTMINGFAEIGITFLLFTVGLEMSYKKLKESLGISMLAGIIQVITVALVSFFILVAFAFSKTEAAWLGIAIAFSSTVVVTKILADKNELNTLHARFIIGIMLAQDILAIVALAVLTKEFTIAFILFTLIKIAIIVLAAFLAVLAAKEIFKKASSSVELLFIISLAFLFLFVMLSYALNFSIAIGAFTAGIILANTPYKLEIETRTKALRDFFSVMFFVSIGMMLTSITKEILLPLIPVLFILIIFEPLVTALVLRLSGYKTKTSLDIGFSFAQLSEFTLILVLTALSLGIITQRAFDLIVLTAIISIAITPYTMKLSKPFYNIFKFMDKIQISKKEESYLTYGKKTILLFGCHRMGSVFLKNLEKYKEKLLVVDFNPEIISALARRHVSCIYGDASNAEFINSLHLSDVKVAISTIPNKENNALLIKNIKERNKNIFVAVVAEKIHDALELYEIGADYVILPLITGAEHSLELIKKLNKQEFKKIRQEQIKYLQGLHRALY